MYRLVLYILTFFFVIAFVLSFFGFFHFTPTNLFISLVTVTFISSITNYIFAKVFNAPANLESVYITAYILVLIITPPQFNLYGQYFSLAIWASIWAVASKFIFAIKNKHIFNPAAFAVLLTSLTINQSASWWIGNSYMLPFVVVGGILVVRKIRRFDMVTIFLLVGILTNILGFYFLKNVSALDTILKTALATPLFFFAFIMLTEPLTTPPSLRLRMVYGALLGFMSAPIVNIGGIYFSPESALIMGNIFSYIVSPKKKLILKLKECFKIGKDTYEFSFENKQAFSFKPGQYMEWTLPAINADSRGNRRYFTISSSPTEKEVKLGVKFYSEPSSFKKQLMEMKPGDSIVASQTAGDFVMPNDKRSKLVFIAGGIGVTPFRSMIAYLIHNKEKRNITLFYCNKKEEEVCYKETLDRGQAEIGLKTVYLFSDTDNVVSWPNARMGRLNAKMITEEVQDYKDCIFYISGPHSMVTAFEETLKSISIPKRNIVVDYFPGFA